MPSSPGLATPPSTSARWRWCRSARPPSSACSPWAARMRSASTRTWERSICAASASSARPGLPRAYNVHASVDAKHAEDYLASLKHQRRLAPATLEPTEVRRAVAVLHAKRLSPRTLALVLSAWRGWFRWLCRHRGFSANPVFGIRAPKAPRPLPNALSVESTQRLLEAEGDASLLAQRDRAMFELL